jgi:SAM-dependent methyltransferase
MPARKLAHGYKWLAEYYDEIFSPDVAVLKKARGQVLGDILNHMHSACDLAAGTGTTALELAAAGMEVFAVDLSPAMCRLARAKTRASGLPVRVICSDMRTFRLPRQVDLVLCEGDALNHVPRKSDLPLVVRSVQRALKPGGAFYFDVNNAVGFKQFWAGNVWMEKPGVVLVMRNGHRKDGSRAWSDIEMFIRDGRHWRRRRERVEEVSWTAAEILRALRSAGFERVQVWDESPFFGPASPVGPGCRSIYVARKPA